jgi:Flp pilus assembly protein TadD
MNPDFPHSGMIRMAYAQKGMFAATLAEIEKTRRMDGDGPWVGSELAYIYGRTGQQVQAKHALAKLKQWDRHQPVDPGAFVMAYIGMRDNDQAFFWLEKAYAQHSNTMITLKVDPLYDPLRSDPRFQDLLQRVGLER